ncbi:uncharacterized protein LOC143300810 [Babylonia areolata]|uniref:uncharacterized protein LOC143300810 n=1 Tax=Babylonia areolata TaxID=304850 RepID=UPI003FD07A0C
MSVFNSRTGGYKAGVFFLFFASFVFLVGSGAPYWLKTDGLFRNSGYGISVKIHEGLWMMCTTATVSISSATGCAPFGLIGFPWWFHAVRAMEALCTAGLIIACIYAVATNCCRSIPGPQSRILEGFAGLSVVKNLWTDVLIQSLPTLLNVIVTFKLRASLNAFKDQTGECLKGQGLGCKGDEGGSSQPSRNWSAPTGCCTDEVIELIRSPQETLNFCSLPGLSLSSLNTLVRL